MNVRRCRLGVIGVAAAMACSLLASPALAQLNPPPGPVAPTMKRLDQLDARRVVSSLPGSQGAVHVISEPGQYMLDRDIDCPGGKSAIVVTACGDVSIDLNGFSLRGSPGAVYGIHRASSCPSSGTPGGGGSAEPVGMAISSKGAPSSAVATRPPKKAHKIVGFQTGIFTGDLDSDGLMSVSVSSVHFEQCGQGAVHLHARSVSHDDVSCGSTTSGDALHVELSSSSSNPGTAPSGSSRYSASGCLVESSSSRGLYVSSASGAHITIVGSDFGRTAAQGMYVAASSGVLLTIRGSNFSDTGSHGLHVAHAGGVAPINDPPLLRISDTTSSRCGGSGVLVVGDPSSSSMVVKLENVLVSSCVLDSVSVSNAGSLDVSSCKATGSTKAGYNIKTSTAVRIQSSDSSGGTTGFSLEDCGFVSLERCSARDFDLVGVSCSHAGGGGGGAGKVSFQDLSIVSPRDPASGQATGKRGMVLSGLDSATCVRVSVGDVDGDGVAAVSCGKVSFQDITITKRSGAPGAPVSHGLHLTDCNDAECVSVSVRGCSGDGMRCVWSAGPVAQSSGGRVFAHALHVHHSGGSGLRVLCPSGAAQVDCTLESCVFAGNLGDGVLVQVPSPQCAMRLSSSQPKIVDNGGSGLRVAAHPQSSVSVHVRQGECSGNAGDGVSVTSGVSSTSLRGGGTCIVQEMVLTRNGLSGIVSEVPLTLSRCTCSENFSNGVRVYSDDPFTQIAALQDCVLQRNGAACLSVGRGRYSVTNSSISDGLSVGIESSDGCALLTNTQVQRCAGAGISISSSTLYMFGGAVRRNGSTGVTCVSAMCSFTDATIELNGSSCPAGASCGGARFTDCSSVTFDRCDVSRNTGDGVSFSSSSITDMPTWSSSSSKFSRNTGNGLSLSGCVVTLDRCDASTNALVGASLSSTCSRGSVSSCSFSDNGGGGLRVLGTRNIVTACRATASAVSPPFEISQGNAACPVVDITTNPRCDPSSNVVH